jgi:ABC-2 type transport system ATP-binding protein
VWLRGLLRTLAGEDRAVLVSSHLMSEMAQLADRLVVIGRGRLIADSTPEHLIAGHDTLEAAFLDLTRADTSYHGRTR